MNRSNLIDNLSNRLPYMKKSEVSEASLLLIDLISNALYENDRIEVRGFGTFSIRQSAARLARNPKTGSSIALSSKFYPYFRPSKLLRQAVNN